MIEYQAGEGIFFKYELPFSANAGIASAGVRVRVAKVVVFDEVEDHPTELSWQCWPARHVDCRGPGIKETWDGEGVEG